MSVHDTAIGRPAIAVGARVLRIAAAVRDFLDRLDRKAERDRAIRELQSQPDHILRDIGLDRHDIRRRVRGRKDDD